MNWDKEVLKRATKWIIFAAASYLILGEVGVALVAILWCFKG